MTTTTVSSQFQTQNARRIFPLVNGFDQSVKTAMAIKIFSAIDGETLARAQRKRRSAFQFDKLEPRQMLNAAPLAINNFAFTTDVNTTLTISLTANGVLNNQFEQNWNLVIATVKVNPRSNA